MTRPDDDIIRQLRDPENPRTPLGFKLLDRQTGDHPDLVPRDATCQFHRTTGFICGATSGPSKPISKMFWDPDRE